MQKNDMMPVLFIGHGSPMNAIEDNQFLPHLAAVSRKPAPTQSHPVRFRSLGNIGDRCNRHAPTTHHP